MEREGASGAAASKCRLSVVPQTAVKCLVRLRLQHNSRLLNSCVLCSLPQREK